MAREDVRPKAQEHETAHGLSEERRTWIFFPSPMGHPAWRQEEPVSSQPFLPPPAGLGLGLGLLIGIREPGLGGV